MCTWSIELSFSFSVILAMDAIQAVWVLFICTSLPQTQHYVLIFNNVPSQWYIPITVNDPEMFLISKEIFQTWEKIGYTFHAFWELRYKGLCSARSVHPWLKISLWTTCREHAQPIWPCVYMVKHIYCMYSTVYISSGTKKGLCTVCKLRTFHLQGVSFYIYDSVLYTWQLIYVYSYMCTHNSVIIKYSLLMGYHIYRFV